jgi:monoamine oxidase
MARTPAFDRFVRLLQEARRRNLAARGEPPPVGGQKRRWSRRGFIRSAAAAGGAALAAGAFPHLALAAGAPRPRVVVVGGGIAGLNAAWQLKKAGVEATLYEARRRLGGRILTVRDVVGDGLITELGASFINSDHDDMLALVEDFDLPLFNRIKDTRRFPFPAIAYFFEGRRREEEEVADDLRSIADQIMEDADRLDEDWDEVAPELDQLSVKDYLDLHADLIGESYIRRLLNDVIRTEYGVEPRHSSALQLIFELPTVDGDRVDVLGASDEKFIVRGGNDRIISGLESALEGRIERGRRLRRVEAAGDGFRLTFGADHVVEADYVILAIPNTTLRRVDLAVDLSRGLRRFIREVSLGTNEKVIAGFASRPWRTDEGFVLQAWTDLDFPIVWDATQRQVEREDGAVTFYFGARGARGLGGAASEGQAAVEALNPFIPGLAAEATGRFLRTRWARDPFTLGAYTSFRPGQLTEFGEFLYIESDDPEEQQDVHVGNLVFAGEQFSDFYYGFMNGGAETGRLAAQVVLRRLAKGHGKRAA